MKQGFSLIELMVVIAIVAILSAIAVPSYKSYVISARLSSIAPIVDGIIQKSIVYASQYGHFPSAGQLNMVTPSGQSSLRTTSAALLSPYLNFAYINDMSTNAGIPSHSTTNCGQAGYIDLELNTDTIGLGTNAVAKVACFMAHKNGAIESKCFYSYTTKNTNSHVYTALSGNMVSSPSDGQLIPGWINAGSTQHAQVLAFLTGSTCM